MIHRPNPADRRHRVAQKPCECRRGLVPHRERPKPLWARVDCVQLVCSLALGAVGWLILFGAISHAYLIGGSLFVPGLFLWALAWLAGGMCAWWSVEPIFAETKDEERNAA